MPGWTGGQYSILRAALALGVAAVCLGRLPLVEGAPAVLLALGLPGALALGLGWRDRAVTVNLLLLIVAVAAPIDGAPLVTPLPDLCWVTVGLALHLTVPVGPFGSWDARERVDPRGDWRRPRFSLVVSGLALGGLHVARAILQPWSSASRPGLDESLATAASAVGLGLALLFLLSLLRPAWSRRSWSALTLWQIASLTAFGPFPGDAALLLVHAFAADPGWWPGRSLQPESPGPRDVDAPTSPAHLYYDGDCGFCHRSVRVVLAEETATPESLRLRFAPLQSEHFERAVAARPDVDAEALPDSIVLVLEDGRMLTRSAAALEIASRLGGFWRGLARVARWVPSGVLDRLYDGIARIRKRLFAQPKDACPILPPDLRARFDA